MKEEGVVVIHLPIGPLNHALGWSRYQDTNPVPTSPLDDDITTASSGPVTLLVQVASYYHSVI